MGGRWRNVASARAEVGSREAGTERQGGTMGGSLDTGGGRQEVGGGRWEVGGGRWEVGDDTRQLAAGGRQEAGAGSARAALMILIGCHHTW